MSDHSIVYYIVKAGAIKAPAKRIEYRSYKRYIKYNFTDELSKVDWSSVNNEQDIDL